MTEPPEQPGSQRTEPTGLDPEDAPVELDQDGYLLRPARRWQFPIELDAGVWWAGVGVVVVAAISTLAMLASTTLNAWTAGDGSVPLPRPDGYYFLILLAGVLLLIVRRGAGADVGRPRWSMAAACLAAGTGGALMVVALVGNVAAIVDPSEAVYGLGGSPLPATDIAAVVIDGLQGLTTVAVAGFAAVLAVLLYRWSRTPAVPASEGGQGNESDFEDGDPSSPPARRPGGSTGPPVASLLLGAALAAACLIAFAAGNRSQVDSGTGLFPTGTVQSTSWPPGCTGASCIISATSGVNLGGWSVAPLGPTSKPVYECTTTSLSGGGVCTVSDPIEPEVPPSSS